MRGANKPTIMTTNEVPRSFASLVNKEANNDKDNHRALRRINLLMQRHRLKLLRCLFCKFIRDLVLACMVISWVKE